MFTRHHYEVIAEILCTERRIEGVSRRMADFFENEDPEFSRDKFLYACGESIIPHIVLVEHGDPADRISFTVSTNGATGSHPFSSIAYMKRYLRGLYPNATFEVLRGSA